MPCTRPIHGFRGQDGKVKFSRSGAFRDQPMTIACGQCIGCKLEKSRQWAVRCVHEAKMHETSCFITLTYDDEHLPEDGSLVLGDWQLFAKRLRANVGKFRFMMCGEYGDKTMRPHYHALIFGLDFFEGQKTIRESGNGKDRLYENKVLTEIWGKGKHCPIGAMTFESAAYVSRYTTKKIVGHQAARHYGGEKIRTRPGREGTVHCDLQFRRKPEFATMSRNPGLGQTWYAKYGKDVYPRDEVISRGRRAKPPRYYDTLLERENPELMRRIKSERKATAQEHKEEQTYDKLEIKEKIIRAKSKREKRTI